MTSNKIPLAIKILAIIYEHPVFTGLLLGIAIMLAVIEFA